MDVFVLSRLLKVRISVLFLSLCVYAKINDLGFIETPYRKVVDSKVDLSGNGIIYLAAEEEEDKLIAQGNAPLNDDGSFVNNRIKARQDADYPVIEPQVRLMDVSPSSDCFYRSIINSILGA